MNVSNLTTYLNDHYAGSVGALQLIDHLGDACTDEERKTGYRALKKEIEADQALLKGLLTSLGSDESVLKKAGAWLAEKISHLKLTLSDSARGDLALLEGLEILSLGIEGKLALWQTLNAVVRSLPDVELDFIRLEDRAKWQRKTVEEWRLQAAARALADMDPADGLNAAATQES